MRSQAVYMEITKDEYELPIVVADSAEELARKVGRTRDAIYSSIAHSRQLGYFSRYIRVELSDDEDEED